MPLFLITGLPGTGKTTVCAELKSRGNEAYDGDQDGLAGWYDRKTGLMVAPEGWPTLEFIQAHSRDIPRKTVEKLALKAKDKPVFLCGDPENEEDLQDLFAKKFALILSKDAIKDRLAARTNNQWGKLPHELEYSFELWQPSYDMYEKYAYITLDATLPTKTIVDRILEETL